MQPCTATRLGCCLLLSVILSPLRAASTEAQQPSCDNALLTIAGGGQPYAARGDRCEGTYKQPVGAGIFLRSIFQSYENFDLKQSRDPLVVEWSPPAGGKITLRADGWVAGEPYRMDASPPPDSRSFLWQTRVLRALSSGSREPLSRRELAVRAWSDSAGTQLFLPVRIWQSKKPEPCGPVQVVLWAMSRPDSVYVQVRSADAAGGAAAAARRELGGRPYPLNGPLTVKLPEIQGPGLYQVKLSAKLGQDPWAQQYLVYIGDDVKTSCS